MGGAQKRGCDLRSLPMGYARLRAKSRQLIHKGYLAAHPHPSRQEAGCR